MVPKKVVAIACLILGLTGCVPSLYELYTDQTLIGDEALVGCWGESGEDELWCFEAPSKEDKSYRLTIREGDQVSPMIAHLVELDGQRYLDLYPEDPDDLPAGNWYKFHLLPVHTFMKVELNDPNLVLSVMHPEKVRDLLELKPGLVKHERKDDGVLLTAPPEALQKFIRSPEFLEADPWSDDPAVLQRQESSEPQADDDSM